VAKSALDETRSHRFHYNATIARIDELVNAMTAADDATRRSEAMTYAVNALPVLVAPFAPHIAEELWARMGHAASVHLERYIEPDEGALAVDEITLVVQVNGKVRARISAPTGITEDAAMALAAADSNVRAHIEGKEIRKRVYVTDKLLNLVVA
jgi:leucyl-tRNA synthetase